MVYLEDVVNKQLSSHAEGEPPSIDLSILWGEVLDLVDIPSPKSATDARRDQRGLLAFVQAAHTLDRRSGQQLELHAGGWTINASGGITRTVLCGALLTGVFAMAGVTALAPLVLPAVLPLLFDVHRVQLIPSRKELYLRLVTLPEIVGKVLSARELFEQLPEELKDEVSPSDLVDFLDELQKAGLADKSDLGCVLRQPDEAKFRITWQ
jgi:hypothetical protein